MNKLTLPSIKINLIIMGLFTLTTLFSQNLENHRWQNRIVIVNAPMEESDKYRNQLQELFSAVEELKDRKMVLYEIKNGRFKFTDFQNFEDKPSWQTISNNDKSRRAANSTFKIILIGLDGGIKLERTEMVENTELFGLIDSMPMRRNEVRKRKAKKNTSRNSG